MTETIITSGDDDGAEAVEAAAEAAEAAAEAVGDVAAAVEAAAEAVEAAAEAVEAAAEAPAPELKEEPWPAQETLNTLLGRVESHLGRIEERLALLEAREAQPEPSSAISAEVPPLPDVTEEQEEEMRPKSIWDRIL